MHKDLLPRRNQHNAAGVAHRKKGFMNEKVKSGSRNVAIFGPYLSGKTTLLESLLFVTKAISRKGNVKDGNTIGDSAAAERDRFKKLMLGK